MLVPTVCFSSINACDPWILCTQSVKNRKKQPTWSRILKRQTANVTAESPHALPFCIRAKHRLPSTPVTPQVPEPCRRFNDTDHRISFTNATRFIVDFRFGNNLFHRHFRLKKIAGRSQNLFFWCFAQFIRYISFRQHFPSQTHSARYGLITVLEKRFATPDYVVRVYWDR